MIENTTYDQLTDKLVVETVYDNSSVIEANKIAQNDAPEFGRYKGNFVMVGRVHEGDILRLRTMGYDLLSSDADEVKRAMLYIQSNEPYLLTVPGTPFSRKRATWE